MALYVVGLTDAHGFAVASTLPHWMEGRDEAEISGWERPTVAEA